MTRSTRNGRAALAGAALLAAAQFTSGCTTQSLTLSRIGEVHVRGDGQVSQLFRVRRGTRPVPGLSAERFRFAEDGAPVAPGEADARVDLHAQAFKVFTVVLLDVSGSMREHFAELREAARGFVARMLEEEGAARTHELAIYAFAGDNEIHPLLTEDAVDAYGQPRRRARASHDAAELSAAIEAISCEGATPPAYCADRSTNLHGAVISGVRAMREYMERGRASGVENVAGSLVLFTDGSDRAGRVPRTDVDAELRTLHENEYVFAIGLGEGVDNARLRVIGRNGYVPAAGFVALGAAFTDVAGQLSDVANSYYLLRYCSPSRVGHEVRLTVRAQDAENHEGSMDLMFNPGGAGQNCRLEDAPGQGSSAAPGATPAPGSDAPPAAPPAAAPPPAN